MQKIRWFLLIVGIFLSLLLSLQNSVNTSVNFLWFDAELPLSVLLLATTGAGFLFGALMTASMLRSRAKKKAAAEVAKAKAEKVKSEPEAKSESPSSQPLGG
jgi:uncharacterized integral membrane protein